MLDFWVVWVESWLRRCVFVLWVRLVRILTLLESLDYPSGIPLCVLDLLLCFLVWRTPYVYKVEEGSGGIESHGCLLCNFVRFDHSLCSVQRLLSKLLDVCLACRIVGNSSLRGICTLCLHHSRISDLCSDVEARSLKYSATTMTTYLLQFIHQFRGVSEHLFAGRVQLLRKDLVDNPVLACE
jgi:hypothetical protein